MLRRCFTCVSALCATINLLERFMKLFVSTSATLALAALALVEFSLPAQAALRPACPVGETCPIGTIGITPGTQVNFPDCTGVGQSGSFTLPTTPTPTIDEAISQATADAAAVGECLAMVTGSGNNVFWQGGTSTSSGGD
jgi:hypothetical protein